MSVNSFIISIYKSRKNLLDIFNERGFDITNYDNYNINELGILIDNDQLDMLLENKTNNKKIYVKYFIEKSLNSQKIYDIVEDLFNIENILNKNDDLYIITKDEINDTIMQIMRELWLNENIYVSIISIKRLQFNILKHELVPKHTVLSDEEKEQIKFKYNILKDSQIADISFYDPVSLVLGIRPNNLVEIERNSKTSITSKFYRICKIN